MSTRVRILSFVLFASLAAFATVSTAAARQIKPRTRSARLADPGDPLLPPRPVALGRFVNPFGSGSALVGSAPVGNGPSVLALNPSTHTVYVANGFNDNGPAAGGNTVSVIDTRRCQARHISSCKGPWPTITVGNQPSGIAIDQQTDTVYVANIVDNTVSVFNGATCNGQNSSGCGQTPATVPVGSNPLGIFADPANHTVYVSNAGEEDVSMLDSATCNATDLAACPTIAPPTVNVEATPQDVDVDQTTHTAYVTTFGAQNGWTVFDANTCNATIQSGCGQLGILPGDPSGPNAAEVDLANNTLYTANYDNTISAFDLSTCNAGDLGGCATDTPGTVTPFPDNGIEHDLWLTVDAQLHTVYVVYQKDDALMVVNTNVCNGADPAACATLHPPEIHTGSDPEMVRLDQQTQTLYTANEVDNDVSVIDATRCDAQTTSGCRTRVPEDPIPPGAMAADPAVATTYVANGANTVSMIDTTACNAYRQVGCNAAPPTVTVGPNPVAVAVDPRTHTAYVANFGAGTSGTVTVFDDRTCNATDQVGCGTVATLNVPGGNPDDISVNPRTHTIYVATITGSGPDLVSVFNGATCNAGRTGGCGQTPSTVAVGSSGDAAGNSILSLAIDQATNTIYASNSFDTGFFSPPPFLGNTVYVIDGPTCDAANVAGCGNAPATISLGTDPRFGEPAPFAIAIDQATDTIYTADIFDGEGAGTVSVINGATCNARNATGCDQTPATAPAGFGTAGVAVDPITNRVYATNTEDTSVTTINGNSCNGGNQNGCDDTRTRAIVGDYPGSISVDPAVGSAYVADIEGVSVMPLTPSTRRRPSPLPRAAK